MLAPAEIAGQSSHESAPAVARRAKLQRKHARAAKRRAASHAIAANSAGKPAAKTSDKTADKRTETSADRPLNTPARTARPEPTLPPAAGESGAKPPPAVSDVLPNPAKVQSEVTVAAELAERMTALRVPEVPADTHLVAVLMARPNVRALADLSGKVIAIDERYAKSNAKITAAMNAAGASEVLLLEGQATAITRLTNGEVSAAVVALASPEAAEAFPKIAGFRLFSVMLTP
ncbi:hypothetical protein [Bradyrhizobium sp. USDA 4369]